MNKKQRSILLNLVSVLVITISLVIGMIFVRNSVNKSEAMRIMNLLGQSILEYREVNKSLPPESYLKSQQEKLLDVRLMRFDYRAQWIRYNCPPDTILAYAYKEYNFGIQRGYIVLLLDGTVEWRDKEPFEKELKKQQTDAEIELLLKHQE